MKFTRRHMLQAGGLAAGGLLLPRRGFSKPHALQFGSVQAGTWWANRFTNSNSDLLLNVALPNTTLYPGYDYYKVSARRTYKLLPGMNNPTTFWSYYIEPDPQNPGRTNYIGARSGYLGGAIIARSGRPVKLQVENRLTVDDTTTGAALPLHCIKAPEGGMDVIDNTIAGSPSLYSGIVGGGLPNRITTHLHGGDSRWDSDGHPLTWFTNNPTVNGAGQYWAAGTTHTDTGTLYEYPNNLSARLSWYHDHAESITRLNAYAGIATGYILRDHNEDMLVNAKKLPPYIETSILAGQTGADIQEWPLVIQEKMFQGDALSPELYYHCYYDPAMWTVQSGYPHIPYPSCIPEFYGDVHMVNGVPWPKLDVKRGIYRFRILNASQARFFNLALYKAKNSGVDGKAIPDFTKPGPQFYQIGTEGGLLPAPVKVTKLMLAPAERADVLIDFSACNVDDAFVLYGAAPAPMPGGDPVNDYLMEPSVSGPATVMMFKVVSGALPSNAANGFPNNLWLDRTNIPVPLGNPTAIMPVTLNEGWDNYGRLIQMLGNFTPTSAQEGVYGREFLNVPGANNGLPIVWESHVNGQIEEWSIVNTTGDVHPMHFHIVNVQILSRQSIDMNAFMTNASIKPVGPAVGPDPNERGWKETVRCYPGQITRVRMIFPPGYAGHYVWHCHILEHEEHDMMHEFELT